MKKILIIGTILTALITSSIAEAGYGGGFRGGYFRGSSFGRSYSRPSISRSFNSASRSYRSPTYRSAPLYHPTIPKSYTGHIYKPYVGTSAASTYGPMYHTYNSGPNMATWVMLYWLSQSGHDNGNQFDNFRSQLNTPDPEMSEEKLDCLKYKLDQHLCDNLK